MPKTRVEYWYRDPQSSEEHHVRTETLEHEPEQALNLVNPDGTVFPLWSDYTERDGTQPKDRKVVEHRFDPASSNTIIVVVIDPNS